MEVNKIIEDCIERNKLQSYACFIRGYVFLKIDFIYWLFSYTILNEFFTCCSKDCYSHF